MASLPPRLIVMALELEGQGVFERQGVQVLYTGLGKVNAAIALTRRLAAYRHASSRHRRSSISALPEAGDLSPARWSAAIVSFSETWM